MRMGAIAAYRVTQTLPLRLCRAPECVHRISGASRSRCLAVFILQRNALSPPKFMFEFIVTNDDDGPGQQ